MSYPASRGDSRVTTFRPVSKTLTLEALPTAMASARAHVRTTVADWAIASMAEDATLIVSELVANAVVASGGSDCCHQYTDVAGGGPKVHLRLWSDLKRIVIEVWDRSPRSPEVKQQARDAENGRGLLLVEALSERWGWSHLPGKSGKVVWAELSVG
jgi:anti-sigma regulatory factor (Ser/Thr protein kinase)